MKQLTFVAILNLILSLTAMAGDLKNVPYTYTVNGKNAEMSEAMKSAIAGEQVLRCQSVVLTPSKSGTSFSLKPVKKAKAE